MQQKLRGRKHFRETELTREGGGDGEGGDRGGN